MDGKSSIKKKENWKKVYYYYEVESPFSEESIAFFSCCWDRKLKGHPYSSPTQASLPFPLSLISLFTRLLLFKY